MGICNNEISQNNKNKIKREAEYIIKEAVIEGTPTYLTSKDIDIISTQRKNSICKIINQNNNVIKKGTGFLCLIPFPNEENELPFLITCNHVLNDEDISSKLELKLYFNDNISKILIIDKNKNNRITYNNSQMHDYIMIEILKEDGFSMKDFLKIDKDLFFGIKELEKSHKNYKNISVYIIHYPLGELSSYSSGIINFIDDEIIEHNCATNFGSSGSPIINLADYRVIGIHQSYDKVKNINIGANIKVISENYDNYKKYIMLLKEYNINLNIDIAIDYSAYCSGKVTPTNEKLDDYNKAITMFCNFLLPNNNKINEQSFKVYGFGGIPPNSSYVSHCFNINFGKNEDIVGINNVLMAHKNSLNKIRFWGHRCFHQIFLNIINRIKANLIFKKSERNYYFLLIFTHGVIIDVEKCQNILKEIIDLPLSIIIVGIGRHSDFEFYYKPLEGGIEFDYSNKIDFYEFEACKKNESILYNNLDIFIYENIKSYYEKNSIS